MKFEFDRRDLASRLRGAESCWLLANGLGGYMSASAAFSVTRRDQGILVAAETPSRRFVLVHRLREELTAGGRSLCLSAQSFADGTPTETGLTYLRRFSFDVWPEWEYEAAGVRVRRRCAAAYGSNTAAVLYDIENTTEGPCTLAVTPLLLMVPKGETLEKRLTLELRGDRVVSGDRQVYISTGGAIEPLEPEWERPSYPDDGKDGRPKSGLAGAVCRIVLRVPAGARGSFEIVFSTHAPAVTGAELLSDMARRAEELERISGLRDPVARRLVLSADTFIVDRDPTGGKTIVAGYPFFADWGRDTMISLPGCTLVTGRYEAARSILRTFLAYERNGLVPNLFPEGGSEPMYNTVDAALLLIDCVWRYYRRSGDADFVREAWPVMVRIVSAYRRGTRHAIRMDEDGLISAGAGLDQVTWMDVCVDGILPTPRHGKPVEINAYWYNALRVLRELAPLAGETGEEYGALAERVRESFIRAFWMEDKGYLRDVISGTGADEQIRCNQIWALTMPFAMLSREQEARVVDTVYRHLYTPYGLRTLSPEDPEFHPFYGGPQRERDLAYHQGTVWPYPLGAFYRAYLKVHGNSAAAARQVRRWLEPMGDILREGCVGQLPEIYDGQDPGPSKGCFAQAWSVGEILRVYEALERIEAGAE